MSKNSKDNKEKDLKKAEAEQESCKCEKECAEEACPQCDCKGAEGESTDSCDAHEQGSEQLLKLLNEAEAKRDEYLDMAQRSQAEFANYRRRNQNTYKDAYEEGTCDTVMKFVSVLDNLERASIAQGDGEAVRSGVEMVLKQFLKVMSDMGVSEIEAQDADFDPNLHNAVMREENGAEAGKVLMVLQKGYKIKDKVLRHAMVKVSG